MFSRIARSAASTARTLCTSSQNNAKVTVLGASRGIGQPVTAPEEGSPSPYRPTFPASSSHASRTIPLSSNLTPFLPRGSAIVATLGDACAHNCPDAPYRLTFPASSSHASRTFPLPSDLTPFLPRGSSSCLPSMFMD
ncbi:malate dehydrogenase, mitochondrial-like [Paramormyrops kingsleyae]|uniref:malate dehydrogenase, mitochondrial-like n=1 Tax=Paramormyrops kingsleyae TaxID=1676925 RepID=UPI003B96D7D3